MMRLSLWILLFAILSLVLFILLGFLRIPFPLYRWISYQDAFGPSTPLMLMPIYWILFNNSADGQSGLAEEIVFLVLVALWVEGQGVHLSANATSFLMEKLSGSGLIDLDSNFVYRQVHFLDDVLGNYLWHAGILGLMGLLIFREGRRPAGLSTIWWPTLLAGLSTVSSSSQ